MGECVGKSRIRLAAMSYWAKESVSRLRTLEASAICAEEGGRRGSLQRSQYQKQTINQVGHQVLTATQLEVSETWASKDECLSQIASSSQRL